MNGGQYVIFRLGKEEYGVPISKVKEIVQYKGATKLPGTTAAIAGIINLRGKIIPVIDLAIYLSVGQCQNVDRRAVILESGHYSIAVLVDEVTQVINIDEESIQAAPSASQFESRFVEGIGKTGDRLLILLNMSQLVAEKDFAGLNEAV